MHAEHDRDQTSYVQWRHDRGELMTRKHEHSEPRRGYSKPALLWLLAWSAVGAYFLHRAVPQPRSTAGVTMVATSRGATGPGCRTKNIEEVTAGEWVWACDPATGEWSPREVLQPLVHEYRGDVIAVSVAGEHNEATGNHPFWVVQGAELAARPVAEDVPGEERDRVSTPRGAGRWVEARHLRSGDRLLLRSGATPAVEAVTFRQDRVSVYNLEVQGLHTYGVGRDGVLVHNKKPPDGGGWGVRE